MKKRTMNHNQRELRNEEQGKRGAERKTAVSPTSTSKPQPQAASQSPWYSVVNRRAGVLLLLLALLLLLPASGALAQNYSFAVPELKMQVFVQPDASIHIVYDITFENYGSAIDVVDIGTPNNNYNLSNFSASINGRSLTDIRTSTYIDTGVEVHLDGATIPSGQSGTLHVEFTMPDMVYEDTTQDGYASLQITPTWFDSDLVRGNSDVWILIHMLPEVQPDEVLYQDVPFTDKVIYEEHTVVGWRWPEGTATAPNEVGVSFPQRGMTRVVQQSLLDITLKWLQDNPAVSFTLGLITFILVAVAFFRFSGGTGISVFALLACGLIYLLFMSPLVSLFAWIPALAFLIYVEKKRGKNKDTYLPAIAQVEGGGIKRGLTAPEAAVLLEMPLNKILLLIMFGLLDKKAVRLVDDSPLTVAVEKDYIVKGDTASKRRHDRREVAQKFGVVLRDYEHDMLDVLQDNAAKPVHKQDFGPAMKELIQSVVDKMKGFDLSDTQDYYKKIISRAMEEAKRMGDVPELEKFLDRTWPWILMDDNYGPVFRRGGYSYQPIWVRPYIGGGGSAVPSGGGKSSGPSYGGKTSFGDVAASFAGWTENTAGKLATSISPATLSGSGGLVNLGGADKVTGDIFKALSSSSGSHGGGSSGGGCACACAGCACACACAGGGR
ncbi:MAG: hypothetical protein H6659_02670 [Ardenticatenaceae bacterium]|nr:hypothetical protein [Ardenticatenaceae bacterium]